MEISSNLDINFYMLQICCPAFFFLLFAAIHSYILVREPIPCRETLKKLAEILMQTVNDCLTRSFMI